jgi:copper(I)-binding protein
MTQDRRPRVPGALASAAKAAAPPLAAGVLLIGALSGWVATGGLGTLARVRIEAVGATIPVPASPGVTAAYLTIRNTGAEPDQLLSVSTGAAARAVLTRNTDTGASGEMSMLSEITIPAHGSTTLGPFGTDIMLTDPRPLRAGQSVTLVLHLRRAGDVTVQALVTPPGTP